MAENNNPYIKVRLAQLDERKKALQAELKELAARRKGYADQLVDEPKSDPQED
ncbi:hypothetical protein [Microbacterium esteraromaticum]|uniref:hypothetical protein n=1 Tax=Microbacterium esteraromaticum TaxID=57043 RepID=UPI0015F3EF79|nr:hypothetical protein [Microbacterium esteraromaticum]